MVRLSKPFYFIDSFVPNLDVTMDMQGFSPRIDAWVVKRMFETELTDHFHDNLQGEGDRIVRVLFEPLKLVDREDPNPIHPYHFCKNDEGKLTTLLHYITVPGDACDLSTGGEDMGRFVRGLDQLKVREEPTFFRYISHNVDSNEQAYGLCSLWLEWAHLAEIVSEDKH